MNRIINILNIFIIVPLLILVLNYKNKLDKNIIKGLLVLSSLIAVLFFYNTLVAIDKTEHFANEGLTIEFMPIDWDGISEIEGLNLVDHLNERFQLGWEIGEVRLMDKTFESANLYNNFGDVVNEIRNKNNWERDRFPYTISFNLDNAIIKNTSPRLFSRVFENLRLGEEIAFNNVRVNLNGTSYPLTSNFEKAGINFYSVSIDIVGHSPLSGADLFYALAANTDGATDGTTDGDTDGDTDGATVATVAGGNGADGFTITSMFNKELGIVEGDLNSHLNKLFLQNWSIMGAQLTDKLSRDEANQIVMGPGYNNLDDVIKEIKKKNDWERDRFPYAIIFYIKDAENQTPKISSKAKVTLDGKSYVLDATFTLNRTKLYFAVIEFSDELYNALVAKVTGGNGADGLCRELTDAHKMDFINNLVLDIRGILYSSTGQSFGFGEKDFLEIRGTKLNLNNSILKTINTNSYLLNSNISNQTVTSAEEELYYEELSRWFSVDDINQRRIPNKLVFSLSDDNNQDNNFIDFIMMVNLPIFYDYNLDGIIQDGEQARWDSDNFFNQYNIIKNIRNINNENDVNNVLNTLDNNNFPITRENIIGLTKNLVSFYIQDLVSFLLHVKVTTGWLFDLVRQLKDIRNRGSTVEASFKWMNILSALVPVFSELGVSNYIEGLLDGNPNNDIEAINTFISNFDNLIIDKGTLYLDDLDLDINLPLKDILNCDTYCRSGNIYYLGDDLSNPLLTPPGFYVVNNIMYLSDKGKTQLTSSIESFMKVAFNLTGQTGTTTNFMTSNLTFLKNLLNLCRKVQGDEIPLPHGTPP